MEAGGQGGAVEEGADVGPGEGPDPRDESVRNAIDIIDEAMGEPVLTDPQKDAIRLLCREWALLWPCATDFPPGSAAWARWGCGSAHAVLLRASSIVLQCCCRSWGGGVSQCVDALGSGSCRFQTWFLGGVLSGGRQLQYPPPCTPPR